MLSNDTLIFLGIALSILLIFVVVHKTGHHEGNDLYSKILDEIRTKIQKAVEGLTEKYNVQERLESMSDSLREASVINGWENTDSAHAGKSDKRLVDTRSRIGRTSSCVEKCMDAFRRFKDMNPVREASPILSQAPLFTALFCLLVVGMHTYIAISCDDKASLTGYVNLTLLTFTYLSLLYWISVWAFRLVVNEYRLFPSKKMVTGRALVAYRKRMKSWTTLGTIPLLAAIFLAWFYFFPILRSLHCSCVFIWLGLFFIFLGGLGFLAKDYRKGIPYLNLYGQIVVILIISILTEYCSRRFGVVVFPKAMMSTRVLDKAVLHFVFLNGFTVPILLPLLYYHGRIWLSKVMLLVRVRFLEWEHKRVIRAFLLSDENEQPSQI